MQIHNYTQPDEFDVYLNDQLLPAETRTTRAQFIMDNWTWGAYPLPLDSLRMGRNEFVFDVKSTNPGIEAPPRLDHVEVVVRYSS